ncbi:unnamed protein product [Soboliphyme baturini]|uniref:Uncharacterized protein n=1 Tax=Soboliphyme baturini TaxID=241478 RepID=A0A183IPE1_9BILA|nr:unnamed protein product [Soboliphyme baturini]
MIILFSVSDPFKEAALYGYVAATVTCTTLSANAATGRSNCGTRPQPPPPSPRPPPPPPPPTTTPFRSSVSPCGSTVLSVDTVSRHNVLVVGPELSLSITSHIGTHPSAVTTQPPTTASPLYPSAMEQRSTASDGR